MAGEQRSWRSGRKRRDVRGALLFSAVVCRRHRRGNVSGGRVSVGAGQLGLDIVGRLGMLARVLWRRSGLLHGNIGHGAGIAVVVGAPCLIQFVGRDNARFLGWTSRAASDALVLHRRDHGFIIRRRHGPIAGATRLQRRCEAIIHGTGGDECAIIQ